MSTRCAIQVTGSEGLYPVAVYKHSDGYPDGQTWLHEFAKAFKKERGDDPEYAIAWIIRTIDTDPYLGVGAFYSKGKPEKIHCDLEYVYTVDLETGLVDVREV